jgi:methylated-DNA-protein-cysteine methyltransferase related protein
MPQPKRPLNNAVAGSPPTTTKTPRSEGAKEQFGSRESPAFVPSFYTRVYACVAAVPRGRVITYGHVALLLGSPAAARAVGYALHNLPAGSEVPWWRVINARGEISLRGRGAAADLQRAMLEREGVVFSAEGVVDLRRYRWWPDGPG